VNARALPHAEDVLRSAAAELDLHGEVRLATQLHALRLRLRQLTDAVQDESETVVTEELVDARLRKHHALVALREGERP